MPTGSPASQVTRRQLLAGAVGIASASLVPTAARASTRLRIGGTGSALAAMRLIADAYMAQHPEVEVLIPPSLGSGGGIRALLGDALDIALSARPAKPDEVARGASAAVYARTPLVVVTAGSAAPAELGVAELEAIYRGERATWSDGCFVRLVLRPTSETDMELLGTLSPAMNDAIQAARQRPGLVVTTTDQENATTLEAFLGSLGTCSIGQLRAEKRQLRPIAIPGTTVHAGDLAGQPGLLEKSLRLVTRPGCSPLADHFTAFVRATEAQAILEATGHLPLNSPTAIL